MRYCTGNKSWRSCEFVFFLILNNKIYNSFRFSQNEKDLEKRYEMLSDKLRELMQINDFNKTSEQKSIESILLNELLNNVMERNELVLQLDEENKLYENS